MKSLQPAYLAMYSAKLQTEVSELFINTMRKLNMEIQIKKRITQLKTLQRQGHLSKVQAEFPTHMKN